MGKHWRTHSTPYFRCKEDSHCATLELRNISKHRMQSFGVLLDDLLSYCTCKLLYRFPSNKKDASFGMFFWHIWVTYRVTLVLTKVSFDSGPPSSLPHVAYSSFLFLGNTKKMSLFSHLIELLILSPKAATVVCGCHAACPRRWAAEGQGVCCAPCRKLGLTASPTTDDYGSPVKS